MQSTPATSTAIGGRPCRSDDSRGRAEDVDVVPALAVERVKRSYGKPSLPGPSVVVRKSEFHRRPRVQQCPSTIKCHLRRSFNLTDSSSGKLAPQNRSLSKIAWYTGRIPPWRQHELRVLHRHFRLRMSISDGKASPKCTCLFWVSFGCPYHWAAHPVCKSAFRKTGIVRNHTEFKTSQFQKVAKNTTP